MNAGQRRRLGRLQLVYRSADQPVQHPALVGWDGARLTPFEQDELALLLEQFDRSAPGYGRPLALVERERMELLLDRIYGRVEPLPGWRRGLSFDELVALDPGALDRLAALQRA